MADMKEAELEPLVMYSTHTRDLISKAAVVTIQDSLCVYVYTLLQSCITVVLHIVFCLLNLRKVCKNDVPGYLLALHPAKN